MKTRRQSAAAWALLLGLIMGALVMCFQPLDSDGTTDATKLETIASRMPNCPRAFGDWESAPMPINDKEFSLSNLVAQNRRVFTNKNTGVELLVNVVVGTGRHISIHSMDFSYRYRGFSLVDGPSIDEWVLGETPVEFASMGMEKLSEGKTEALRAMWSFSEDGRWRAPRSPKRAFAGQGAVAKVLFIGGGGELDDESVCIEFGREYLPLLSEALFGQENRLR